MNITIPNYEILNFELGCLVVSDVGVSKVNSPSLINVLRQLQLLDGITRLELNELLSDNGLSANDAFEFLERIIPLRSVGEEYFDKVVLVHDWKGQAEFEPIFSEELSGGVEFCSFSSDLVQAVRGKRCFVMLVCQLYEYDKLKKIYFDLVEASPKSAVSVSWRVGSYYCVGQPYIAEAGSPCHFCFVDRLINNESFMPVGSSWGRVLKFCKDKKVGVPYKAMSLYQELIVIGAIARKIKFFAGKDGAKKYQDDVLHATYLQLSDGQIFEEPESHWYMCDCLGVET